MDLNDRYRQEGWGRITDEALGIPPQNVEASARSVARWAHDRIEAQAAEIERLRKSLNVIQALGGVKEPEFVGGTGNEDDAREHGYAAAYYHCARIAREALGQPAPLSAGPPINTPWPSEKAGEIDAAINVALKSAEPVRTCETCRRNDGTVTYCTVCIADAALPYWSPKATASEETAP